MRSSKTSLGYKRHPKLRNKPLGRVTALEKKDNLGGEWGTIQIMSRLGEKVANFETFCLLYVIQGVLCNSAVVGPLSKGWKATFLFEIGFLCVNNPGCPGPPECCG